MYDELIDALQCTRHFALYQDCYERNCYANSGKGLYCNIPKLMADAADALEAAEKRIAELEDELRFQLDTRRKETAEIERLKAENLKLQKQNRDCGWNCKQCEYVDKDLQAEESEQRIMELDRRLYELRSFNAKMKGE